MTEEMEEFILDSYRSEVEKRILEVADEKNVKVIKIKISAELDTDNCIIIHNIGTLD